MEIAKSLPPASPPLQSRSTYIKYPASYQPNL